MDKNIPKDIAKKLQKEFHSAEVKGRKIEQKHRKGDYYIQVTSESKAGVSYINLSNMDTFGKIKLNGYTNEGWAYLVNLAKENLKK